MKNFSLTEQEDQKAFSEGQNFYARIGLKNAGDLSTISSEDIESVLVIFDRYVKYLLQNSSGYSADIIDDLLSFPFYLHKKELLNEALSAYDLLHTMTVAKEELFPENLAIKIFKLNLSIHIFEEKRTKVQEPPDQEKESENSSMKSELKEIIKSISDLKIDSGKEYERYKQVFDAVEFLHDRIKDLSQYSAESSRLFPFIELKHNHDLFTDILSHEKNIKLLYLTSSKKIEIKKEADDILTKISLILSSPSFKDIKKILDMQMLLYETIKSVGLIICSTDKSLIECENSLIRAVCEIMTRCDQNFIKIYMLLGFINRLHKPMTKYIFEILSDPTQLFPEVYIGYRDELSRELEKAAIGLANNQRYKPELLLMRSFKISDWNRKKDLLLKKSEEGQWLLVKQLISIYCTSSEIQKLKELLCSLGVRWMELLAQKNQGDLMELVYLLNIPIIEDKSIPHNIRDIYISQKKRTQKKLTEVVEILFNRASNLGPFLGNSDLIRGLATQRLPATLARQIVFFLHFQYFRAVFDHVLPSYINFYRKRTRTNMHLLSFATFCVKLFEENYNEPIDQTCFPELISWLMTELVAPEHKIGRPLLLDKALRMHIAASIVNLAKQKTYLLPAQIKKVITRSLQRVGSLRAEIHAAVSILLSEKKCFFEGHFLPLIGELSRLIDSLTLVWMLHFPKLAIGTVQSQREQLTNLVVESLLSPLPPKVNEDVKASKQPPVFSSPFGLDHYGVFESKEPVSKPDLAAVSFMCLQKIEMTSLTLNAEERRLLSLKDTESTDRPLTATEQKLLSFKSKRAFIRNGEKLFCIDSSACRVISTLQMMSWFKRLESPSSSSSLDAPSKRKR